MELKGKTVLITGAARRIGREIAIGFAKRGAHLLLHYHTSREEAEAVASELTGVAVRLYRADLTQLAQLKSMVGKITGDVGAVDILVHNASSFFATPFQVTTEEEWERFMAIHVKAPYFLAQGLAEAMKKQGGRMILLADGAGLAPRKNYLPYSVSKGALLALTKGLAVELAPEILVNAICPGPIFPPPAMGAAEQEKVRHRTLLGRWGTPKDIAKLALFLAEQDYATGGHYFMDGGESLA